MHISSTVASKFFSTTFAYYLTSVLIFRVVLRGIAGWGRKSAHSTHWWIQKRGRNSFLQVCGWWIFWKELADWYLKLVILTKSGDSGAGVTLEVLHKRVRIHSCSPVSMPSAPELSSILYATGISCSSLILLIWRRGSCIVVLVLCRTFAIRNGYMRKVVILDIEKLLSSRRWDADMDNSMYRNNSRQTSRKGSDRTPLVHDWVNFWPIMIIWTCSRCRLKRPIGWNQRCYHLLNFYRRSVHLRLGSVQNDWNNNSLGGCCLEMAALFTFGPIDGCRWLVCVLRLLTAWNSLFVKHGIFFLRNRAVFRRNHSKDEWFWKSCAHLGWSRKWCGLFKPSHD